jgi:uncharacterized RDD family membrane protein YckC
VNPAISPYDFPDIAPASLAQRFAAVLVDALIWLPLMLVGVLALGEAASLLVIAYLGLVAYAEGKTGQSPGKYMSGVRVLAWHDGQPIGVGRSIWRMVCRAVGSFYLLGWALAIFNPDRRAAHDLFAASVVVTCPPAPKSMRHYLDEVQQAM